MSLTSPSAPRPQAARFDLPGLCGALCIVIAALMLGIGSQRHGSIVPVCLFAIATLFVPERLRRSAPIVAYALLAGAFLLWQQAQATPLTGLGATRFHGAFFAAHACISCGALALFGPRTQISRVPWAVCFGITGLCFAGAGFPNWLARQDTWQRALPGLADHVTPRMAYGGATFLYGVLAAVALRGALPRKAGAGSGRALRALLLVVILGVTLGISEATATTIRAHYDDLSKLYVNLARGLRLRASGGFSGKAELGDVVSGHSDDGGQAVALSVIADEAPGYMRGRAFLRYTGRGWDVGKDAGGVPADMDGFSRWTIPGRGAPDEAQAPAMIVEPADRYGAVLFTPLEAQAVDGPSEKVILHTGGILHTSAQSSADGYRIWTSEALVHGGARAPEYLELPEDPELLAAIDAHIALAKLRDAAGNPLDPPTVVRRLVKHFDARYTYKFGIRFEDGSDPLTQFLRVKKHGHCELFASSGALILRRLGFRARYVTGFVCTERNQYDERLWIARNRMAHAWVEAYHPATGWKTLEFTPGSGFPPSAPTSGWDHFLEWVQGLWTRFKAIPWSELPGQLALAIQSAIAWVFAAWYRIGALAAAILAVAIWRWRTRPKPEPPPPSTLAPEVEAARETYLELDATLGVHGLGRAPSETLLAQAARLRVCEWPPELGQERENVVTRIEAFAAARYGPQAHPKAAS